MYSEIIGTSNQLQTIQTEQDYMTQFDKEKENDKKNSPNNTQSNTDH